VTDSDATFPRLAYVGDVPVEASFHGSALIYRLLQDYPADRLLIIEAGLEASQPARRLQHVRYRFLPSRFRRLRSTRFGGRYEAARTAFAKYRGRRIAAELRDFGPDAILSVSHGASWIAAAEAAQRLKVPLHLICHDEWVRFPGAIDFALDREKLFGRIYRSAFSRLCVSPFMAENYERRFGAPGDVLYPSRAKDAAVRAAPSPENKSGDATLVCAFAGSISSSGYVRALAQLAEALQHQGAQLHIFGPVDAKAAAAAGLHHDNICFRGLLPSSELIDTLHAEADILFAPMSFDPADRANMELSFPSKLTDYTITGLPLLIVGPDYCSAVRWAQLYDGVAEYLTDPAGAGLSDAVGRLADPGYRRALGQRAADIGHELFAYERAEQIMHRALHEGAASEGRKKETAA
jgi:hypothetical protein